MASSAEILWQLKESMAIKINDFALEVLTKIALPKIVLTNIVCLFYSLE
jgi:hypothetical protein